METSIPYPSHNAKFSDEGVDPLTGKLVYFIRNDVSERQYDFFIPQITHGVTSAGLARLNQSIEVFVTCILGGRVNVRSSILNNTDSAIEAQREFFVLFEGAISQAERSAVSASNTGGESQKRFRDLPRDLVLPFSDDSQHREYSWLNTTSLYTQAMV